MFARVQVEHELLERPLEPGQRPLQYDEARAGHFGRGVEIHEAKRLADLEMLLGLEALRERRQATVLAKLDIVVLVLAVRRIGERQVGDRGEFQIQRRAGLPLGRLQFRHRRLEPGDLGAIVVGRDTILARHRHADLLRDGVAPLLRGLERQDRRPALLVQRDQLFRPRAQPAAPQALVKSFRVLADRSDIVHDLTLSGGERRRARRQELGLSPAH